MPVIEQVCDDPCSLHPTVLFFSRGRGRGHAVPDVAIANALLELHPELAIAFVSYGTGADTIAHLGHSVIDLGVEDVPTLWEVMVPASMLILHFKPRLVLSHEEFAVPPAAVIARVPSVFITDWFGDLQTVTMQALSYAQKIVFIESPGLFEDPPSLANKIVHVGPVIRHMSYGKDDKLRARAELHLPTDCTILSVIPGVWAEEHRVPLVKVLSSAFAELGRAKKCMIWIAGRDHDRLLSEFAGDSRVIVKKSHEPIEQLMVASDLIVTKGNRGTIIEAACLGIPSISISSGINPVDEVIISTISSHLALRRAGLRGTDLRYAIEYCLERKVEISAQYQNSNGAQRLARWLSGYLRELRVLTI